MKGSKRVRVNAEIRAPKVRLIGDDREQLGVFDLHVAKAKALEMGLDLVEVSPNADPPVCRILDYGKFRFERTKGTKNKAAAAKKKAKQQTKEVKFRPTIDIGDYNVKLRMIVRFIEGGHKVKITVRFRGREMAHQDLGIELLERIAADVGEIGNVEQMPKLEGRQLLMLVAPAPAKAKAASSKTGSKSDDEKKKEA